MRVNRSNLFFYLLSASWLIVPSQADNLNLQVFRISAKGDALTNQFLNKELFYPKGHKLAGKVIEPIKVIGDDTNCKLLSQEEYEALSRNEQENWNSCASQLQKKNYVFYKDSPSEKEENLFKALPVTSDNPRSRRFEWGVPCGEQGIECYSGLENSGNSSIDIQFDDVVIDKKVGKHSIGLIKFHNGENSPYTQLGQLNMDFALRFTIETYNKFDIFYRLDVQHESTPEKKDSSSQPDKLTVKGEAVRNNNYTYIGTDARFYTINLLPIDTTLSPMEGKDESLSVMVDISNETLESIFNSNNSSTKAMYIAEAIKVEDKLDNLNTMTVKGNPLEQKVSSLLGTTLVNAKKESTSAIGINEARLLAQGKIIANINTKTSESNFIESLSKNMFAYVSLIALQSNMQQLNGFASLGSSSEGLWIKPWLEIGFNSANNSSLSYHYNFRNIAAGYSFQLQKLTIGTSFGYGEGIANSTLNSTANTKTYLISTQLAYRKGQFGVDSSVQGGYGTNATQRTLINEDTYKATFGTWLYGANVNGTYAITAGQFNFVPSLGIKAYGAKFNQYQETSRLDLFNSKLNNATVYSIELPIALLVNYKIGAFIPFVQYEWSGLVARQINIDSVELSNFNIGNLSLDSYANSLSKATIGIDSQLLKSMEVGMKYSYSFNTKSDSHFATLSLKGNF